MKQEAQGAEQQTDTAQAQQQDEEELFGAQTPPASLWEPGEPPLPLPFERPPAFFTKREPLSPGSEKGTPPKCRDSKDVDSFSTPPKHAKAETSHRPGSGRKVKTEGNMKRDLSESEWVKVLGDVGRKKLG